jgi:hypothetical protein
MDLINFTGAFTLRRALLCSALVVPGLAPVTVFAQDQAEACQQLQDAGGQINFEQSNITEDEFRQVVDRNTLDMPQPTITMNRDFAAAERRRHGRCSAGDVPRQRRAGWVWSGWL